MFFRKIQPKNHLRNLILVVGSGMNSGKTTIASKLIHGLSKEGFKIAACKLTGSVSDRDQNELYSASSTHIKDFSDYGFPSTYMCRKNELLGLFDTMTADLEKTNPDITLMEIADGVLQKETKMILENAKIKRKVTGVLLAAESATSALFAVKYLKNLNHKVISVSGSITSSPLASREFQKNCEVPLVSSADSGKNLFESVIRYIKTT